MTYLELIESANLKFETNKVTLGEYERMIEPLKREIQPEIIRCKDCKHKHVENMVWVCPFGLSGGENFFCGYGTEPYFCPNCGADMRGDNP